MKPVAGPDEFDDDDEIGFNTPHLKAWNLGCTLRREYVLCGKGDCSKLHGPYWYGYIRVGRRLRKVYFGKACPSRDMVERRIRKLERAAAAQRAKRRRSREGGSAARPRGKRPSAAGRGATPNAAKLAKRRSKR